jgi:hypothetical protein
VEQHAASDPPDPGAQPPASIRPAAWRSRSSRYDAVNLIEGGTAALRAPAARAARGVARGRRGRGARPASCPVALSDPGGADRCEIRTRCRRSAPASRPPGDPGRGVAANALWPGARRDGSGATPRVRAARPARVSTSSRPPSFQPAGVPRTVGAGFRGRSRLTSGSQFSPPPPPAVNSPRLHGGLQRGQVARRRQQPPHGAPTRRTSVASLGRRARAERCGTRSRQTCGHVRFHNKHRSRTARRFAAARDERGRRRHRALYDSKYAYHPLASRDRGPVG